jgi:hypothetical protein
VVCNVYFIIEKSIPLEVRMVKSNSIIFIVKILLVLGFSSCLSGGNAISRQQELAQELTLETEISGILNTFDVHWFRIQVMESGRIVIETFGNTDTYLKAFDTNNNKIAENDDGGQGNNARLEIPVMIGNTYFIKLSGYGRSSGPYRIIAFDEIQRQEVARRELEAREQELLAREQERLTREQEHFIFVDTQFREVLASRNVDIIMHFLNSDALNSPLSSENSRTIIREGQLEVAKILTGNNNIRIRNLTDTWVSFWGHDRNNSPVNPSAFERDVVYTGVIISDQVVDNAIVVMQLGRRPEQSLLFQNISSQDIKHTIFRDVMVVYNGLMPMRLANGRIVDFPLFNVLYYRK